MLRGLRVRWPVVAEEKIHPEGLLGMSKLESAKKLAGINGVYFFGCKLKIMRSPPREAFKILTIAQIAQIDI